MNERPRQDSPGPAALTYACTVYTTQLPGLYCDAAVPRRYRDRGLALLALLLMTITPSVGRMSFLSSLQQFVSSGVASLNLNQRRFSLSRESSGDDAGQSAAHGAGHGAQGQGPLGAAGPAGPSGLAAQRRDSTSPHHGFPKVINRRDSAGRGRAERGSGPRGEGGQPSPRLGEQKQIPENGPARGSAQCGALRPAQPWRRRPSCFYALRPGAPRQGPKAEGRASCRLIRSARRRAAVPAVPWPAS